jgi:hypothetical protein
MASLNQETIIIHVTINCRVVGIGVLAQGVKAS